MDIQNQVRLLQEELAQTDQGLLALTLELSQIVDQQMVELDEAKGHLEAVQEELADTSAGLIAMTVELQDKDEELRDISQQLWQTAKLATMGELAASVAHELNNPLQTVGLRIDTLAAQLSTDEPKRAALQVVEQELERMANLVNSLLQFSRRGGQRISTVDVSAEIGSTLDLIYYRLGKRNIRVVRDFGSDVPSVHADREQLRQVFLNLFTNASDAMPHGGVLTIRVRAEGPIGAEATAASHPAPSCGEGINGAPTRVVIEVADTGVGIAPEDLPRVMNQFFTTKPEGKGTGLGLAICRRVVESHGGTFQLTSELGKGTTARIVLPLSRGGQEARRRAVRNGRRTESADG